MFGPAAGRDPNTSAPHRQEFGPNSHHTPRTSSWSPGAWREHQRSWEWLEDGLEPEESCQGSDLTPLKPSAGPLISARRVQEEVINPGADQSDQKFWEAESGAEVFVRFGALPERSVCLCVSRWEPSDLWFGENGSREAPHRTGFSQ